MTAASRDSLMAETAIACRSRRRKCRARRRAPRAVYRRKLENLTQRAMIETIGPIPRDGGPGD
jgi:hypothetical protein